MDLKEIISISGMSGLHKLEAQRDNGIIVRPLTEDKKKFISSRQHMFTPLENITVYNSEDGIELKEVFKEMKKQEKENPLPDNKADNNKLYNYFEKIVPDYDRDKVYASDIKKIIKWYEILDKEQLISLEENNENTEASSADSDKEEEKES